MTGASVPDSDPDTVVATIGGAVAAVAAGAGSPGVEPNSAGSHVVAPESAASTLADAAQGVVPPLLDPRTLRLVTAPIVPLLLTMAWPNVVVMLAQASTGLIETFWVSRLGTSALAGMALVFPGVMLMQMISAGSLGGGISSAIARALGAGRKDDADALVVHALIIDVVLGLLSTALALAFGPALYRVLGGDGASLHAALQYSNVVFGGIVLIWLMNGLASAVRGTGNMLVPALVTCAGTAILVPLSPMLIFGIGPFPALGIAGGGVAMLLTFGGGAAFLAWYILAGRSIVHIRRARPQRRLFGAILGVGAVATISSLQTNVTIGWATALVATVAGPDGVAGYGTGARLEYLLIPLVFGLGAPLVALVGTNIGAGHPQRALRIAFIGGAIAFCLTEVIGIAAALWPRAWLGIFGSDPGMLSTGSAYLRAAGPFYGFFGGGLALYFASQGAGRLGWPLVAGLLRMVVALAGGWLALHATHSLLAFFFAVGLGMLTYGTIVTIAVASGSWFTRRPIAGRRSRSA